MKTGFVPFLCFLVLPTSLGLLLDKMGLAASILNYCLPVAWCQAHLHGTRVPLSPCTTKIAGTVDQVTEKYKTARRKTDKLAGFLKTKTV